ncbi:cadmium-sensing regulator CadC [Planifilum fimeticola]|jgi:ArsR family transcriptional regulator, lead/cadmium/zinc/bismuth-responsive transcriptional repressor|uniref:Cadmium-sensing regulator CadC n=1 Tax=Planifilum fimeticola TaxID=201975 RepID=A0A2T0LEV7_9BACL|nr:metalloregulator ArsR/SmtB family transcription factor [Planifilum fimeticola]PRX40700.1 cadmium-sensing regulator CadC [Planifilum fimeticola]
MSSSKRDEVCEVFCHDPEKVRRIKEHLPDTETLVSVFKALADPTRLKIAFALMEEGELCVCDLAHVLESTVATASHHLRLMKNLGLAKSRKEGKLVFYSLKDEHVRQILAIAMEHHAEDRGR